MTVTQLGWRACLTDLGRLDAERLGVPAGGALDRHSASVANILVGNPRAAEVIEAIGPLGVVADQPLLVAVAGAPAAVRINGAPADQWHPVLVPAGHQLEIGAAQAGLRTYLAVAGGLQAARFLGSAAPDPRMGFLQRLTPGSTVMVGRQAGLPSPHRFDGAVFRFGVPRFEPPDGPWTLHVVAAGEHDQIDRIGELMAASGYTVLPESDHVGVRLAGPVVHPDGPEIVSHGVPVGAVEIPHADDELILLGRYRTLTAGYPVVGVVARTDLDLLGQLAAGQQVRFSWLSRPAAAARAVAAEAALTALERAVSTAFAAIADRRIH